MKGRFLLPRARGAALAALWALLSCGDPTGGLPPRGLAYGLNPAVYTVGSPIAPNLPSGDGGAATSWTVSPALPPGLVLDGSTGIVSGTPTAVSPAAPYTVTATNGAGSASVALQVAVEAALAPPAQLAYATNPAVYALGIPIPANAPSSQGGAPSTYAVEPALPAGLALDPSSGVISGTPASLAAGALHTVTAANEAGSADCTVRISVMAAGSVWISPQTAAMTTRATAWFTAGVAGSDEAIDWTVSAGQIDAAGVFTAPRLPGAVTVTAASAGAPESSATAAVAVFARVTGNIEVRLVEPAGGELPVDVLRVEARVETRYLLDSVEADLDGTPIPLAIDGGGPWSGEIDVSVLPAGSYWLRVAAHDTTGAETEVFRELTRGVTPLRRD